MMTAFAPILQAFFTDYLQGQLRASEHTVAAYRDTFRLLLTFTTDRTGGNEERPRRRNSQGAVAQIGVVAQRGDPGRIQQTCRDLPNFESTMVNTPPSWSTFSRSRRTASQIRKPVTVRSPINVCRSPPGAADGTGRPPPGSTPRYPIANTDTEACG